MINLSELLKGSDVKTIVVELISIKSSRATIKVSLSGEGGELFWWTPRALNPGQSIRIGAPIEIRLIEG